MTIPKLYELYKKHPLISTDTRKITAGCIFFALKGDNFNANEFANQAIQQGASYAIIDDKQYKVDDHYILVEDVLQTLQDLAHYHRSQLNIPFIGITGSNGKTTSKELLNSVLSQKFKTYATLGNLNNHIGVPLTILSIDPSIELAIIEMGANHQGEIASLSAIANPNYGIITNVGRAHLEGFGGEEGVKKGKKELFDHLKKNEGIAFINRDSANLVEMGSELKNIVFYGKNNDNYVSGRTLPGEEVTLEWKDSTSNDWQKVQSNLVGDYNFENILAAICIGHYFELTEKEIKTGIESYIPTNNRSQVKHTEKNVLICDYYNANPSSMQAAIGNFAKTEGSDKMLILADMFELGVYSKEEHRKIIDQLLVNGFKNVYLIGKDFYAVKKNESFNYFETTNEALDAIKSHPPINQLILVKGSRGMKLETLIDYL
ncbi:UDP-N-acetylmuramoyl-tripeptide--D-alanyl-D-alanine ligase [Solitalea koreensis]|uniref:UDP-N-acetylmuramoyl-tripeptide--D-alanyl-D-alanine ligase n=1 Tax=Solitalea koreensis TaxID=543615 RepID=A0A521CLZ2_9SPHI|nr:UDP-N-acetylmuramoyl-tripeptide--D-alanyl-D-alanine ligase [Solitalea koreensis]SMO60458.1 UDP-N-acetylmuramoyl-tripeptide--D-alanyl-D-alanine ligase [Solitalea koreensis]